MADKKEKKQPLGLKEVGASGTEIFGGYIYEEYNSKLVGQTGREVYEKMRRSDAQVFATLLACEIPIRSTKWFVNPYVGEDEEINDQDKEIADFVEKNLFNKMDTTWDDFLRQALTMLAFGFSLFEKVYKLDGDKIIIKKLAPRIQSSIQKWKTMNGGNGVTQELFSDQKGTGETMVSIPEEKLLLFSYRREGDNYEGVSILRSAYKHRYIKDQLYKFDTVRQERQSIGIPVMYLPEGASTTDLEAAEAIVKNIRGTECTGVVIPGPKDAGWSFEFADLKASSQVDPFTSINHHNREISKNVLAQFLELGNTASGSRSLGDSQSELFLMAMENIARYIADTINKNLIPELVDLNYNTENYPKITFKRIISADFDVISNSLSTLAGGGIISPDSKLENHVRDMLDLPVKEEETEEEVEDVEELLYPENEEEIKEVEAKQKIIEKKDDEYKKEMFEFKEFTDLIDNRFITELQNEIRTAEDRAVLKKKGFKLNEFEKEAFRPLTFAERKVNLKAINKSMDLFEAKLQESILEITEKQKNDLLKQIKKAVENNDIKALGEIKVKYNNELSQAITEVQKEMFEVGKKTASAEMGVKVPPTKTEVKGAMRVQNDALVAGITGKMENTAKEEVINTINSKGGISNTTAHEAIGAVNSSLTESMKKLSSTVETLSVAGSLNLGRTTIFEKYPEKIYAVQYSAILDNKTTDYCRSLDGRVVKAGSPEYYNYNPPKHYGCRSIWVEILNEEEFKPKITGITQQIPVQKSLNDSIKMYKPVIIKNSPAIKSIQEELQEREDKLEKLQESGLYPNRQKAHEKRIKSLKSSLKGKFIEYFLENFIGQS